MNISLFLKIDPALFPAAMEENPLINQSFKLQKFQGKGGWTYVSIPAIIPFNKTAFGWRRVKGYIDDYEIKNYHLMPMGNGTLFLPVKAQIRKKLNKTEGDSVKVVLYHDLDPLLIPEDLLMCLQDEPAAYKKFTALTEGYQKEFISWINAAVKEETKANRIADMITLLLNDKTLSKK